MCSDDVNEQPSTEVPPLLPSFSPPTAIFYCSLNHCATRLGILFKILHAVETENCKETTFCLLAGFAIWTLSGRVKLLVFSFWLSLALAR